MNRPQFTYTRKSTETSTKPETDIELSTEKSSLPELLIDAQSKLNQAVEDSSGGASMPDNKFNYDSWSIKEVGADRGDGWAYCVCSSCFPGKAAIGATPTLMLNLEDGYFFCHECGRHGDASKQPGNYQAKYINFNRKWWHEPSKEEVENIMIESKLLPNDFVFKNDLEVFQDFTFISNSNGELVKVNSLLFPCRKNKDGDILSFIVIPFDENFKFHYPKGMKGTPALTWGWENVEIDENHSRIVFVTHPLELIAIESTGIQNVVCLNPRSNTNQADNGDWTCLSAYENTINKTERFVMAMGTDHTNESISDYLARRLGKDRCLRVRWSAYPLRSGNTPNAYELLHERSLQNLEEAINEAPAFPISGIREALELSDEIDVIYEHGLKAGERIGYPSLDYFFKVAKGEATLISGIPGHGKTTLVDNIAVLLGKNHQWKSGVFSPGFKNTARHFASYIEKYARGPFDNSHNNRISTELKNEGKNWVNEHIKIILPQRHSSELKDLEDKTQSTKSGVDWLIEKTRALVLRHGIKILVVDSWDDLEHQRPSYVTETEFLNQEIKKLLQFVALFELHLFVTVNPKQITKMADGEYPVITPYMLNNGAVWLARMDNVLSPYRFVSGTDNDVLDIHVQKIKHEENGQIGLCSLYFEKAGSFLKDQIDQEKRAESIRKPKENRYASHQLLAAKEKTYQKGQEHIKIQHSSKSPF